jgi:CDP-diacylglycerol--glycerol-3-phosphate 3-phosphatidyltransferase
LTSSPPTSRPAKPRSERSERRRQALIESRLTPNAISLTGLVLCIVAAALVWENQVWEGGIVFIFGSICDTLDGRYSRMSGKASLWGAFLDSTLDRVEEGIVLMAVGANFASDGNRAAVAAVIVAVFASLLVSYTRARAEALGVECKVGIASRAIRVIILSAGLVLSGVTISGTSLLEPAIYILAALSSITVLQRIFHVRKALTAPPFTSA